MIFWKLHQVPKITKSKSRQPKLTSVENYLYPSIWEGLGAWGGSSKYCKCSFALKKLLVWKPVRRVSGEMFEKSPTRKRFQGSLHITLEIISLRWPGNTCVLLWRAGGVGWGWGRSVLLSHVTLFLQSAIKQQRMDATDENKGGRIDGLVWKSWIGKKEIWVEFKN